jgi:hypothetical protein
MHLPARSTRRALLSILMLAAFAVRALVPEGFMPAAGAPLALEICPEGSGPLASSHLAHHHHGTPGAHGEHCVFGSAGAGGPAPHSSAPHFVPGPLPAAALRRSAPLSDVRLVYLPQPRGPPTLS